ARLRAARRTRVRKRSGEFLETGGSLETSKWRTEAEVRTMSERDVIASLWTPDIKAFRIFKHRGIAIGRSEQKEQVRLGGDRHPSYFGRLSRPTPPRDHR